MEKKNKCFHGLLPLFSPPNSSATAANGSNKISRGYDVWEIGKKEDDEFLLIYAISAAPWKEGKRGGDRTRWKVFPRATTFPCRRRRKCCRRRRSSGKSSGSRQTFQSYVDSRLATFPPNLAQGTFTPANRMQSCRTYLRYWRLLLRKINSYR